MIRQGLLFCSLVCGTAFMAWSSPQAGTQPAETKHNAEKPADAKEINVEALKKQLDAGDDIFLLDVRRPDELQQEGMIKGAVNIPMDQLESRLSEIPKDKPLAIYCHSGGRASRAAGSLRAKGYAQPIEYGGIVAWKGKGYPVEFPAKTKPSEAAKP